MVIVPFTAKTADAPEPAEYITELHPQSRVFFVLLIELVFFKLFPAECAYDPDAGKVFLRHGGKNAFLLVDLGKLIADPVAEIVRVKQNDRHKGQGDEREGHVHGEHHKQREYDKEHDTEHIDELLGYKVTERVDVRSAALDYVTRLVFVVPRERQLLYVHKQRVSHILRQRFGSACVRDARQITEKRVQQRRYEDYERNYP